MARAVAESLGADVDWDGDTKTVFVNLAVYDNSYYNEDDGWDNWSEWDDWDEEKTTPIDTHTPTQIFGTVTVQYNADGVDGPPNHSVNKDSDGLARFNLSSTIPSRDGFIFLGWMLENDIAYDVDSPGQSITIQLERDIDEVLTYYAQWDSSVTFRLSSQ